MKADLMMKFIWIAGGIQAGIVFANFMLPRMLRVRDGVSTLPRFLKQVFYVHWIYIVIVVGFFIVLSFVFARELSGASALGRFLSAFIAAFWLLRIVLQWFYYDPVTRRQHRLLDILYTLSLIALVAIFGAAAMHC
jgi:hypothetical protein